MDPLAPVGPDPQDRRPLGAAEPLVPVAGPVRGAKPVQGDRNHAGRMRPVDERVDAAAVELGHEVLDRAGGARSGS